MWIIVFNILLIFGFYLSYLWGAAKASVSPASYLRYKRKKFDEKVYDDFNEKYIAFVIDYMDSHPDSVIDF